jgi:hypothetical protein
VIVGVDPDPANAGAIRQWTVDYWEATHPYAGGGCINFLMDEGQDRVRASYRDNYQRLAEVKPTTTPTTSSASTRTSRRRGDTRRVRRN